MRQALRNQSRSGLPFEAKGGIIELVLVRSFNIPLIPTVWPTKLLQGDCHIHGGEAGQPRSTD
jgi:hypothetical protein